MQTDRSFLGFKQLLLRFINGPEVPSPAAKPARPESDRGEPEPRDDWIRVEL